MKQKQNPNMEKSYETEKVNNFNSMIGHLDGYNCTICHNKGYIAIEKNGSMILERCKCMPVRQSLKNLQRSGIKTSRFTFEKFEISEPWQKSMKELALKYSNSPYGWFFAGGQVGSGKTHICTAILLNLLHNGYSCRYMQWKEASVKIKAVVNEAAEYQEQVEPLKKIHVLYIDDFWKTERGKKPTTADINLAFEILNCRYNNPRLLTLISTEMYIDELISIDEAVGSRIYEMTKKFCLVIQRNSEKNYRFKGE